MKKNTIGVIGAGNSARALAVYLSKKNFDVWMYSRRVEALSNIKESGTIKAEGIIEGTFPIAGVTHQWRKITKKCSIIFIATVATAYEDVANAMSAYLNENHRIILFSGKLCGSLLFERTLINNGVFNIPIIETDSLFACRTQKDGTIWIRAFKNWTLYSCTQYSKTLKYGKLINSFFPNLKPATNLIQRGLTDFGAHAHAVIAIANLSRIDLGESFLFYYNGLSERTIQLLERVEQEIKEVALAYGTSIIPMKNLLDRYYGCKTESLLDAITSVASYKHSKSPDKLCHRFLIEDVSCTLIPLAELAKKAKVKIPMIDAVVAIASTLLNNKIHHVARSLKKLGLDKMIVGEIKTWINHVNTIKA